MIITEYQCIYCGTNFDNFDEKSLSQKHFNMLESFILCNDDLSKVMRVSQKGNRKVIRTSQYVGLIQLDDGLKIEILPKIYDNLNVSNSKSIFLEMLKTICNINFVNSGFANTDILRYPIFDIFIEMFIKEVRNVLHLGLSCSYENILANESFFNGKLLIPQNLRYNYIHKERFFIQYDVFTQNNSQNRLLKSTLLLLRTIANDINKNSINELLSYFKDIQPSTDYERDFSKCENNPDCYIYKNILNLARIFLNNKSFSSFSGNGISYALLFPMNDIFERYIATLVKKRYINYDISIQDTSTYLFEECHNKFNLRPDIVVRDNFKTICILDTKWKSLKDNSIDIQDMYQMYVYAKKFNCNNVMLIYPKIEGVSLNETSYHSDDITINIKFIDLHSLILENKILNDDILDITNLK